MLSEIRGKFRRVEDALGKIFSKLGLTPNQFTFISILFAITSFYFLIKTNLILALFFFIFSALLDLIDGSVARVLQKETKKGAYLDTICDRYVEGIILLGFLFLPLSSFIFSAKVWVFFALFGSLMTTYSKAAAKEKELIGEELKKGLLGRPERMILISLAMVLGIFNFSWIIYPIIILAIFSNISAFQRIYLNLTS